MDPQIPNIFQNMFDVLHSNAQNVYQQVHENMENMNFHANILSFEPAFIYTQSGEDYVIQAVNGLNDLYCTILRSFDHINFE